MKKHVKSLISLILCVALLFSAVTVAFSANKKCACGHAPVIFVHGVGSPLYEEIDGSREMVFMPDNSIMIKSILMTALTLPFTAALGAWDQSADIVSKLCLSLFGEIRCDENGDSVNDILINSSTGPSVTKHLSGDNRFNFSYDWRLDPVENAGHLEDYIDQVLAATGHDKVKLLAYSEGGEVVLSYLAVYGSDKVEKCVTHCSAFQGVSLVGNLFSGNIAFNSKQLANFAGTILPAVGVPKAVAGLVKALHYTGLYVVILALLNNVVEHCFDKFYKDAALPVFACMPGMFGFVPYDYYNAAIEYSFGGQEEKYAGLIEKLDRYHKIQGNARQILQECVDNGMQIALVSNYDCYPMPFVGKNVYQSDGLIDSANTSGGATFAPIGKTFDEDYVQKVDDGHNHISPDRKVDASTCMFPDNTWFISGFCHWNDPDDMLDWLLDYNGQPTIFSDPAYPQFLVGNPSDASVSPQTNK